MRTRTTSPVLEGTLLQQEIDLELDAVRAGVQRYRRLVREAVERGEGANLKPAERILLHWYKPMLKAVRQELRGLKKADGTLDGRRPYGPLMSQLDAERLAVVSIQEILSACMAEPNGVKLIALANTVGRGVAAEVYLDSLREMGTKTVRELDKRWRRRTAQRVQAFARKKLSETWPRKVLVHLGVRMIWLLIGVASLDDYDKPFRLAFHHKRKREGKKTPAYIIPDLELFRIIEDGHALRQYMRPRYLPMLVPPCPWTKDAQGGYVRIRTPYISKPTPTQKAALSRADLSTVNECLNALTATGWMINGKILEAMKALWETGGGTLGLPMRDNRPLPAKPADFESNEAVRQAWRKDAAPIHRANALETGQRIEFINKIGVAEQMSKYEAFYFPHQLDFRGRCYPVPVHLNHQGDDVCRGLLMFSTPKTVTDEAFFWLKVHAANCYGHDKMDFQTRAAWVDANPTVIEGCANSPLDHIEYWGKAKKPWQFLAACIALADPHYGERMPVQMDGTCNGLQHYAALGRDEYGARVVNLAPSSTPADVYSDVAAATARIVEADVADSKTTHTFRYQKQDHTVSSAELAQIVNGMITRSVVKSTVMTSVYGVTMVGARKQVMEALKEVGLKDEALYKAGIYLSKVVLNGMTKVCQSARQIMDWLRACAIAITEQNEPVAWTTPLGLPVVQPYRRYYWKEVPTVMGSVFMQVQDESVPVAVGKQCDGFAPNFVHSLDASHMLSSARECHRRGIEFASVHDSYWTHAATVEPMGQVLREEFVKLHHLPILEDLEADFKKKHPKIEIPALPPKGNFNIDNVLTSDYFFS